MSEERKAPSAINWYPGHMNKAKNEIIEKLKIVDIALVLLDARIPYSSQNPMLFDILKNKPKLILLTKCTMADSSMTDKWINHFNGLGITALAIDSITGMNVKKIESSCKIVLKEKIEKDLSRGLKPRAIRAMIVGIPNVGKSTLINKLVNKKVAQVGNKPGVTKAQQWIRINQNIDLLDTPGVLWPKFDDVLVGINLALTGAIKDEILKKEDLAFHLIDFLKENYFLSLNRYDIIESNWDNLKILDQILSYNGIKNTGYEYDRAYDILLNDFKNGRLGKVTLDRI